MKELNGVKQVDGTKEGFDSTKLENGYLTLVRTDEDKENGYIYLNGKKYGQDNRHIDCGKY